MRLNADPTSSTRIWETYLRPSGLVWARIGSPAELDQIDARAAVLILPSVVVLNDAERKAILAWRERGGSVLSTWKAGSHDADGKPGNYDFMRQVLDVEVVGDTAALPEDTFMVLSGDNPLLNSLPPGLRVWIERVPGQLPLRFKGKNEAAQILTWSRNVVAKSPSGVIAYNDRVMGTGRSSRVVTLGFPEQTWQRSDPRLFKALTDDIFAWLLHRPKAYLGHWPHPYTSATVFALQVAEPLNEGDEEIARTLERAGGRVTIYLHSINAKASLDRAARLQAAGHELAYFGDQFEPFNTSSVTKQAQRLDAMRKGMAESGLKIPEPPSFATPADSYNHATLALLLERGFGNFLGFTEVTEAQLPVVWRRDPANAPKSQPMVTATWLSLPGVTPTKAVPLAEGTVVLPRTLVGPEEAMDLDSDDGLANFARAYSLAHQAAALAVVAMPSQSLLLPAQRKEALAAIEQLRTQTWIATATAVSNWWRARSQVQFTQSLDDQGMVIELNVGQAQAAGQPLAVFLDLPSAPDSIPVEVLAGNGPAPNVMKLKSDRAVLVWPSPKIGVHRWRVRLPATP